MVRPQHLATYGCADIAELAAAYLFGVARNPPFIDGNKRTAYVVSKTFIGLHCYRPHIETMDIFDTVSAVAAGTMSEQELAEWFRGHITSASPQSDDSGSKPHLIG